MRIVDGQLDLAMNALMWNRDLSATVDEIRKTEAGMQGKARARATVALPQMRQGNVGLCFAAILYRTSDAWQHGSDMDASVQSITYAQARGQLAYYELMESLGEMRKICTKQDLASHLEDWGDQISASDPVAYVLRMEGSDPIVYPNMLNEWWDRGVRSLSLAHFGVATYAHGTGSKGGLREGANQLLDLCQDKGMLLDLTHLSDESFWQVINRYDGHVCASHQTCRALVPGDRQMDDAQLLAIIKTDGVIGTAFKGRSLHPDWPDSLNALEPPVPVNLDRVVDHIDHVCSMAGDTLHSAVGSDLDGGYGNEESPDGIDTIADTYKLADALSARGFSDPDVENIMWKNWITLLRRALPD